MQGIENPTCGCRTAATRWRSPRATITASSRAATRSPLSALPLGLVYGGDGADAFNIRSTGGQTDLNGGGGNDTTVIGDHHSLANIGGRVLFNGEGTLQEVAQPDLRERPGPPLLAGISAAGLRQHVSADAQLQLQRHERRLRPVADRPDPVQPGRRRRPAGGRAGRQHHPGPGPGAGAAASRSRGVQELCGVQKHQNARPPSSSTPTSWKSRPRPTCRRSSPAPTARASSSTSTPTRTACSRRRAHPRSST